MASSSKFSKDDDNKIKIENEDFTDSNDDDDENQDERDIVERVYHDKLVDIKKELFQLQEGTHVDYVKELKKFEKIQKDQSRMNSLQRDKMTESVEREYTRDCRLAMKEFDDGINKRKQTLIAELDKKKKAILQDYLAAELSLDSIDQKPTITRNLRRRPNDSAIPVLQEKRRNSPLVSNINYSLHENEIEQDLKVIQESLASISSTSATKTPIVQTCDVNSASMRKGFRPNSNSLSVNISPEKNHNSDSEGSSPTIDTRIEDGKLLFKKRWYHRGQSIFVEERQMAQFPAVISAIGFETIWVKRISDKSKFRIKLSYLSKGRMSIKRRAVV